MATAHPIPASPKFQDLTGKVFGNKTVLHYVGKRNGAHTWQFRCVCGYEGEIGSKPLKKLKECCIGCRTRPPDEDFTGRTFGIRIVESYAGNSQWNCICVKCGRKTVAYTKVLKDCANSPPGRRCHCELAATNKANAIHGMTGSVELQCWQDMLRRPYAGHCHGMEVSLLNFLDLVGPKPEGKCTIDRIDNDSIYTCGRCDECVKNGWPLNIRWATMKTQQNNKSNNRLIEHEGRFYTLTQLAEKSGMGRDILSWRLKRMSLEQALTMPVKSQRKKKS
jgi:hypothetical protein